MPQHTDREYASKLQNVRESLLMMAGRVEAMIARSMEALTTRDPDLARQVVASDREVNQLEIDTDELCLQILARWQPVASDLRFVTKALKMVTDLERIGDLAVNISERVIDLSSAPPLGHYERIPKMGTLVQAMVRDAIDAFVELDATRARAVIARDDEVDDLYTAVFSEVLHLMLEDSARIHRGIHVQSVAKWLERIGDHACNLAEEVIFMVKGKDIRHLGKL